MGNGPGERPRVHPSPGITLPPSLRESSRGILAILHPARRARLTLKLRPPPGWLQAGWSMRLLAVGCGCWLLAVGWSGQAGQAGLSRKLRDEHSTQAPGPKGFCGVEPTRRARTAAPPREASHDQPRVHDGARRVRVARDTVRFSPGHPQRTSLWTWALSLFLPSSFEAVGRRGP